MGSQDVGVLSPSLQGPWDPLWKWNEMELTMVGAEPMGGHPCQGADVDTDGVGPWA